MLKLNKKQKEVIIIILLVLVVGFLFYLGGTFTGQVVENCTEVEVCENVTVENCTEVCFESCENVTNEVCDVEIVEVCEDNCTEVENETICEENCYDVNETVCYDVNETVCEEVCDEVNCTEEVVENCTIQVVCENVSVSEPELNETNESVDVVENVSDLEDSAEEMIDEDPIIDIDEEELSLTTFEENLIKLKTGESILVVTKSQVVNDRLILRLEISNYWVEKSYDYSLDENLLNSLIERDRIKFLKKIGTSHPNIVSEEKEEYLVEYEI